MANKPFHIQFDPDTPALTVFTIKQIIDIYEAIGSIMRPLVEAMNAAYLGTMALRALDEIDHETMERMLARFLYFDGAVKPLADNYTRILEDLKAKHHVKKKQEAEEETIMKDEDVWSGLIEQ